MMKKKTRTEFDYQFDIKNEITMVRWKDNNVVTMGSNFDDIVPLGKNLDMERKNKEMV